MQRTQAKKVIGGEKQQNDLQDDQQQGGQQQHGKQQDVELVEKGGGQHPQDPGGQGTGETGEDVSPGGGDPVRPVGGAEGAGALGTGIGTTISEGGSNNTFHVTGSGGKSQQDSAGNSNTKGSKGGGSNAGKKQKTVKEDRAREAIKKLERQHHQILADSKRMLEQPSSYYADTIEGQAESLRGYINDLVAHHFTVKAGMWDRGIRGQPIFAIDRKREEIKRGLDVVNNLMDAAKVVR